MFDVFFSNSYNSYNRFQKKDERPALPQVQPTGDTSPGAQDTMAMNILKILAERRQKLSKYFEILNFKFYDYASNF
jgi:hypothetical protein